MNESVTLARDVEAAVIPVGTKVTLQKGEQAFITQSLGGSYTVVVKGNMFRMKAKMPRRLAFNPPRSWSARAGRKRRSNSTRKSGTNCEAVMIPRFLSISWISV